MNSNHTTTETQKLKQQVLDDIKRVKDDINQITQRLTPGQIIDDVIYQRRVGATPASTFTYLKENPIGTTFLTLGTLLLMEDSRHISYESTVRTRLGDAKDQMDLMKGKVQSSIHDVKNKFSRNKGESIDIETKEGFSERTHEVKDKIKHKMDSARSKVEEAKGKFKDVSHVVRDKGHEYFEASKNLDPMTYMVLGAGLGTITGASIPLSDAERQLVDTNFESKISNFGQELQTALNESVNILKNEILGEFTDFKFELFK